MAQQENNKCDACGQEVGLTGVWKVKLVGKPLKIKAALSKFRAKLPVKFHPRIGKIEGLFAELSEMMSDLESYKKQIQSLADKFIQEKGGTEKTALDLNFCESCWKEWGLQENELGQIFKEKYGDGDEAEGKEIERKFKEIEEECEKLFSDFAEEVGKERAEQIVKEIEEEIKNEFLAEMKRNRNVPIPKPGTPPPTNPPTNNPDQTDKINRLEREKQELITKNQTLETQLKNSQLSPDEKISKQRELSTNKDLIGEKDKEIDKLKKQKPTNTENNKDNSKLNWAIGLGIAAVVIGLLCFFFLMIARRKNKH